jgi:hypothetical protein
MRLTVHPHLLFAPKVNLRDAERVTERATGMLRSVMMLNQTVRELQVRYLRPAMARERVANRDEKPVNAGRQPLTSRSSVGVKRRESIRIERPVSRPMVVSRPTGHFGEAEQSREAAARRSGREWWNNPGNSQSVRQSIAPQSVNVEQITENVLRQLDRRVDAWRERTGRK